MHGVSTLDCSEQTEEIHNHADTNNYDTNTIKTSKLHKHDSKCMGPLEGECCLALVRQFFFAFTLFTCEEAIVESCQKSLPKATI
jgi:hypothetical protein